MSKPTQSRSRMLVLALFGGIALAGGAQAADIKARHELITRSDPKGEVRLDVTVRGRGPLVIMVPSLGRGAADFDDLATRLAAAGYETAAVDPRGAGRSTGPMEGLTFADYAADVSAVMDKLTHGKEPVILLGHAFGTRIVRATADAHPDRVPIMIMIGSAGQGRPGPAVARGITDVFDTSLPPAEHLAAVQKQFFAPGNIPPASWLIGWYPAVRRAEIGAGMASGVETGVGSSNASILVVHGDDDSAAPPANSQALAKDHPDRVTAVALPHAGHAMLPEQPQAIGDIVISYLKTHAPLP